MEVDDARALLAAAADGDQAAWDRIVDRYTPLLWAVARSYRLGEADAADVLQTAWLRLLENARRITEPDRLGAWLATVVRHEIHRMHRRGVRTALTDDVAVLDAAAGPGEGAEQPSLAAERDQVLWEVFSRLTDRCQRLLRAVVTGTVADDPLPYRAASARLGIPVGGIGPTRMRCLEELRSGLRARGITGEPEGS